MAPGPKKNAPVSSAANERPLLHQVRDALMSIVLDEEASASARASAGRTVVDIEKAEAAPTSRRPLDEASIEELDDEIAAQLQRRRGGA